ncbi:hypothetical protein [Streptomyces iakyrus]|jgi:hypothetical protein|uniref:hypothetical protein n=1 Tax=Streptomyces iakyrus TaxID=68219 RepID=UPI0005270AF8|nr:hypothetical protein [Streptomyces iakyrus]
MPAIFHVDQARTFKAVMFMSVAPKTVFGKNDVQDTTKDGTPKWEVQVVASFEQFGKIENEILKIGVNSHKNPGEALQHMPQPVELVGFRVGVSPVEKRTDSNGRERITGGTAWYQADEVRALNAVPAGRKSEG